MRLKRSMIAFLDFRKLLFWTLLSAAIVPLLLLQKTSVRVPLNNLRENAFFFVVDMNRPRATLIDASGSQIWDWQSPVRIKKWHYALPLPDLKIAVVEKDRAIRVLDKDSTTVWEKRGGFHHHVIFEKKKGIFVFERQPRKVALKDQTFYVVGEILWNFSLDGEVLSKTDITDLLLPHVSTTAIEAAKNFQYGNPMYKIDPDSPADIFHINSLDFTSFPHGHPLAHSELVVSVSVENAVAFLDLSLNKVLRWDHVTEEFLHGVDVSNSNTLTFFENGRSRLFSKVYEYDPAQKRFTWRCDNIDGQRFYSKNRGSVTRITKDQYLLTVAEMGLAAIIDRNCSAFWLYWNRDANNHIQSLYEIQKIEDDLHWLGHLS